MKVIGIQVNMVYLFNSVNDRVFHFLVINVGLRFTSPLWFRFRVMSFAYEHQHKSIHWDNHNVTVSYIQLLLTFDIIPSKIYLVLSFSKTV